jgi:hypothetical protein
VPEFVVEVPKQAEEVARFIAVQLKDAASGLPVRSAIDTVERFQGGERTVILVSATESDRAYLLASSEFLLDPRRLTVALSQAKRKMILVASRSIFSLFMAGVRGPTCSTRPRPWGGWPPAITASWPRRLPGDANGCGPGPPGVT